MNKSSHWERNPSPMTAPIAPTAGKHMAQAMVATTVPTTPTLSVTMRTICRTCLS